MGADRLKEIKDHAKRGWNKAGQRLLNPIQLSFFDSSPTFGRRSFRVILKQKLEAAIGEELLLHTDNNNQFVTRGPEVLGECPELPASILDELKAGSVVCVEVVGVGTITNTIEVAPK